MANAPAQFHHRLHPQHPDRFRRFTHARPTVRGATIGPAFAQRSIAIEGEVMANRILRMPEVRSICGLSRSTIYRRMEEDTFPKAVPLGGRLTGWAESEVQEWVELRISERDLSSKPHRKGEGRAVCEGSLTYAEGWREDRTDACAFASSHW